MSEHQSADRVVVGVDGSESSKQALRWAEFVARASGASVEAVAAWHIPPAVAVDGWPADWRPDEDTATTLHGTVEEVLGASPAIPVREVVREGGAASVLLDASRDARLLVVGSRGHGGFAGLLLGSVSAACAEHAHCPVLVIHGDTAPPPAR